MTYPPPSGGWQDPSASGQQSSPPVDPTLPMSGSPIPSQPQPADPYAAPQPANPYGGPQPANPYAGPQPPSASPAGGYAAPGYAPPGGDPYAAGGYPPAGGDPYAAGGYPPAYPSYPPPAAKTNGLSIAALALSLIGITSCITAPVGAIMGHVALKQIRERGEQGEGMAKAGIIIGWVLTGLMVLGIAAIIVAAILDESSSSY